MMLRIFLALFILSLGAAVAVQYWRVYMPQAPSPASTSVRSTKHAGPECRRPTTTVKASPWGQFIGNRQDLAVTISTTATVISAIASLLQIWFAARARLAKGSGG